MAALYLTVRNSDPGRRCQRRYAPESFLARHAAFGRLPHWQIPRQADLARASLPRFMFFIRATALPMPASLLDRGDSLCAPFCSSCCGSESHLLSFAFLLIFLPLGPVLNARWMPASVFAERYLYLPSVGFCWLVGWAAVKLWNAKGRPLLRPLARAVPVLVGVVALMYAVRTVTRNRDWTSDEVLFRQAIQSQGDASLIHSDLGAIYLQPGNLDAGRARMAGGAICTAPPTSSRWTTWRFCASSSTVIPNRSTIPGERCAARPVYTMAHVDLAETLAAWAATPKPSGNSASPQRSLLFQHAPTTATENSCLRRAAWKMPATEYERSVEADSTSDAYDQLGKSI